jgi:type I restriction enzyme M protein
VQLIDARQFYVKMKKSLGNKRNKIGDPTDDAREPDEIADISLIHGGFQDSETRSLNLDGQQKTLIVSKVFDNADFGFNKITVERPLRLNLQATADRIARLEEEPGFKNLASSNKKAAKARLEEIAAGQERQNQIRALLRAFRAAKGETLYRDRKAFLIDL